LRLQIAYGQPILKPDGTRRCSDKNDFLARSRSFVDAQMPRLFRGFFVSAALDDLWKLPSSPLSGRHSMNAAG